MQAELYNTVRAGDTFKLDLDAFTVFFKLDDGSLVNTDGDRFDEWYFNAEYPVYVSRRPD